MAPPRGSVRSVIPLGSQQLATRGLDTQGDTDIVTHLTPEGARVWSTRRETRGEGFMRERQHMRPS